MEIEILNPSPTYIKITNIINDELSNSLIETLEDNVSDSKDKISVYKLSTNLDINISKKYLKIMSSVHAAIENTYDIANEVFRNSGIERILTNKDYYIVKYPKGLIPVDHIKALYDKKNVMTRVASLFINLNDSNEYHGGEISLSNKEASSDKNTGYLLDRWINYHYNKISNGNKYLLLIPLIGFLKE